MFLLKKIPKVDKFILNEAFSNCSPTLITKLTKEVIGELRNDILNKNIDQFEEKDLIHKVLIKYEELLIPSLKKLINATGIIVHTNLGRSLIDKTTLQKALDIATSYNNLEYNMQEGKRGERYSHIVKTLQQLTGCEDAIIVNNNASAVFLVLNTFAKNKEVIVSRGELVEIGGSFRVPDVMSQSGAILKEVGTTNKTHLKDYQNNCNENTAIMMKVHKSNYTIEGFSSEVALHDMIDVAKQNNVIDYYDMGSGHMVDLPFNLSQNEPSILKIMEHNPSLLSFSGDKLLGSVQAGVIIGKKEYIAQLKQNQLLRMLRVDKITLALLEESFRLYLKNELDAIPTLRMLHTSLETLQQRAHSLQEKIASFCKCEVIESQTLIGGGTTPNKKIPTIALSIEYKDYKPNKIEKLLRKNNLITRIENDKVLLDFRTIQEDEIDQIVQIIKKSVYLMANIIIGTAGHIDHGKTALIKALNGFEGDTTHEEQKRGITIDLSFSNMSKGDKNIAFIDVPGHEKLVKNMIAGAFGFDYVMLVISANEGIKPQTLEHIQIINLLGIKEIIVVITKKDLVQEDMLEKRKCEIQTLLEEYQFTIKFIASVSIYDQKSIDTLQMKLFEIENSTKLKENFFRFYIDRVFSPKGIGTVVTGTVLGQKIELNEKVFLSQLNKEVRIKNIQVHNQNVLEANISNRAALNLHGIDTHQIKKGDILTRKGYMRGFNTIDISFSCLKEKKLKHNHTYFCFIGSKKIDVKVLLIESESSEEKGYATLKADETFFCIFNEKLILRDGNETIAGGKVLIPILDPMRKTQKKVLLESLEKNDFLQAYKILLSIHKKGFGIISSTQRFAMSHNEAIELSSNLENTFIDEKALVIYPTDTRKIIIEYIKNIYTKNQYALLSLNSIQQRIQWASLDFIDSSINLLCKEGFIKKEGNLFIKNEINEDIKHILENRILSRLKDEKFTPTAPYNIYDELDIDRKLGDTILKSLCSKKIVKRLQHNIFIHNDNLVEIIRLIHTIIDKHSFIDLKLFKEYFDASRKYLTCYLDYFDTLKTSKKVGDKRVKIDIC